MKPDRTGQNFFEQMADVIARRYHANAGKSLSDVYQLNPDFLSSESDVDFAVRNRSKILQLLSERDHFEQLLDLFVHLTIEFTFASNQFIQLNAREEAELRRIYGGYLRQIEKMLAKNHSVAEISAGLGTLITGHFGDLRANIARFFDPETNNEAQANVILNQAVCAEYPPEQQLKILGIHLQDLLEPVLDFGCGKSGLLVEYLHHHHIQAVGVDRLINAAPGLIQADWLEVRLEPDSWGTVISHMAFSNHFTFHHLYRHGRVEPYASQYMKILKSLKIGGSFYYTPGLPFIEGYLPSNQYLLSRQIVIDRERLYACRVKRIA